MVGLVLNYTLTDTKSARLEKDHDKKDISGSRRGAQVKI